MGTKNLTGKVALVTGGTKGIGRAIAEHLLAAGASVAVCARTGAEVRAAEAELGDRSLGIVCDVADAGACERMVEATVARFGRLDILVNNAGLGIFKPLREMSVEEWQLQIDVNLGGVFYCSRAALPHLSATGDGFIVNVASLASRHPFRGGTGYNASKYGLLGLTEAMLLDVRYDDVRVSIVMPGSVDTYFHGREQVPERTWRLHVNDCAVAVMQLLSYPKEAHVSRVELRPSQPPRKA
ncbi:MAG: SDR family oxidoreductase [Gemmatimonadales bacterium]|nr:SDR family oxidoreductase [Gemmatimonadales bacterium]MYG50356.1 SDR family oxidoreductase [Gemmatimonadales bacterium]MYK00389.1 SDR family oxidoreductase [Candidatus Palauibacter ramosifaciens]